MSCAANDLVQCSHWVYLSGTRASATKLRKTLAKRAHSDSAELIAFDRRAR